MDKNIAIKVDAVSKNFVLPHQRMSSIKGLITSIGKKNNIQKKEKQKALEDISFEVKKGEFFGIVGRNGSGKSTLLKILANIYQPTTGKVTISGKLVPFIELGVGFNPELTGRENVYLNGSMLGFSEKEITDMYDGIVEFAELERFMDQKLKNYSSGMQVRLAFSMATRAEADILLVDEVLAVGDADFQRKCFDYFKKLKRDKKTVIFVSHDMNSVREYCDKAIMIEKSVIIARGKSEKVARTYSRMFMEESTNKIGVAAKNDKRWGLGTIRYTNIKCKVIKDKINDPVFGFLIRSAGGQSIMGTNTIIIKKKIASVRKNSVINMEWSFDNILQDGEYSIDPAINDTSNNTLDWWEDAAILNILKEDRTPYIVNPEVDFSIEVKA